MIRVNVDGELLDIAARDYFHAVRVAGIVRPNAVVVSDTTAGRNELKEGDDTGLYDGDLVTHWAHPGETGEIVSTMVLRHGRLSFVAWPGSTDRVPHMSADLIRVTSAA